MAKFIEREAALRYLNDIWLTETPTDFMPDDEIEQAKLRCDGFKIAMEAIEDFHAADVVARDCYDRLLAENDELRKERPVVRCKDCFYHVDCGYHHCNKLGSPCADNGDFFCAYGCKDWRDGDGE